MAVSIPPSEEHLARIADEYSLTLRVLSVLVEQLLRATGGDWIQISDEMLADVPDIHAYYDQSRCQFVLRVER